VTKVLFRPKGNAQKHNRALSLKPALVENKENVDINIPNKDVWFNVNRCLEKNGYSKITISSKTDPSAVWNTVLEILYAYEQRGKKIEELLSRQRSNENPYSLLASKEKIASLEDQLLKSKEKIKSLEYDNSLAKTLKGKRKEWPKKEEYSDSKAKDLKLKVAMSLSNLKNVEKENEKLKAKIDQMIQKNEKNERRDAKVFEKLFGKLPRGSDTKVKDIISGYENQKERIEARMSGLEEQLRRLNEANAKLINENKWLLKGSVKANSEYYYMKDEGKLVKRIEELEAVKDNLMKALKRKEETIESNIQELDSVKEVKEELMGKIKALEYDIKQGPSIQDLHKLHNKIAKLESDNSKLQIENNNLEKEIMILKNESNSHLRNYSSVTKNISQKLNFEFDDSSASVLLEKIWEILNIKSSTGNAQILDTVQKIQRVVMAVPRMEAFIKQISSAIFPGQHNPSLEHVIPELHRLNQIMSHLMAMKEEVWHKGKL
jgi:myosin heavy subunit